MKRKVLLAVVIIAAGIGIAILVLLNQKPKKHAVVSDSTTISHVGNNILNTYVSADGKVNYIDILNNREQLDAYRQLLEKSHPNNSWKMEEQLAYWIIAYNTFTVDLILKNYSVNSIRDIGGLIKIPGIQSAWDIEFIKIEDQEYRLGYIEDEILQKEFNEPKIHFAINCASISCPKLLNEAFSADILNAQLNFSAI